MWKDLIIGVIGILIIVILLLNIHLLLLEKKNSE